MALIKPNYYFNDGFVFQKDEKDTRDNGIITVNYLLSSCCQLNCVYCIAKDIIDNYSMPTINEVDLAIKKIIELDPLVTVLTGGEPLLSPHLKYVIESLYGKTNIILDTNGLLLHNQDLDFFRNHNVVFRISLDLPEDINDITRINSFNKNIPILSNSFKYLDNANYPFIISTVINNYNVDRLHYMLYALFLYYPVIGWRLQNIIPCHNLDLREYMSDCNNKLEYFNNEKEQLIESLKDLRKIVPERHFVMQTNDKLSEYSTILLLPDSSISISNTSNNTREILTKEELENKLNTSNHHARYVLNKNLY
jgi:sulfatase maturation enzyme AslB (radical SAM superfamily)